MRKLLFLALVLLLMVVPMTHAQDDSERLSLTIYNQGTALVQDVRTFELETGLNTLDFTDVAASIDATSVVFKSLANPDEVLVLEQNFIFDLVGSGALLNRYLDETISITTDDGITFSGQLLSGRNNEVILRGNDGQISVVSLSKVRNMQFPNLPDGLITRPTLRWLLESGVAGSEPVELTYLTGGINWTADYNVLVNADSDALDLNGWVTLTNTSGASYEDAQVKLVAGDVNRLPEPQAQFREQELMFAGAADAAAPRVEQREFFEYQLYEVVRRVSVADNETKQVEFVTGTGVPANTFFVYNANIGFGGYFGPITDQSYGVTGVTDVQSWLEFSTGEDEGLGADLPAGRIRVYQEDVDGAALLIGENRIDHTPEGEDVKIYLGNAFDLVGEHTQTNFQLITRNVLEETYEIKLRNRKDSEAVEIRVPEKLFRWSNWEILNASDEFSQVDSSTIEFRVTVEPGQEKVITYTVRYSWP